jgi:hypothetical protein
MRIAIFATSAWLTMLGTIALAQGVTYDYDRSASFSRFRTYAWTRGTELTDELDHARVVRVIDTALAAKGLEWLEHSASANVLVAYHASFDQNLEISGAVGGPGLNGLSGDAGEAAGVQPVPMGTLVLDISDARTGAIVWRSLGSTDIKPTDNRESRDEKIAKATKKMLKNYPAPNIGPTWLRLRGLLFKSVFRHRR